MSQLSSMNLNEKENPEANEVAPPEEEEVLSSEFPEEELGLPLFEKEELATPCANAEIHSTEFSEEELGLPLFEKEELSTTCSEEDVGHSTTSESPVNEQNHKKAFEIFSDELKNIDDPEAKLQRAIDFMEESLSLGGTPHFKNFWEARTTSLELFKQNISPSARVLLWSKYSDLSKEARRLKEILEEQSAFAAEQIDIAIQALEKDIETNNETLEQIPEVEFSISALSIETQLPFYKAIQKELNLLNTQAARINALRKELIKTEMRIRQKNKFFQRLSAAGDRVFPRRKELIKQVSQQFADDINEFIRSNFDNQEIRDSIFFLREEIKCLQGMAKLLTLNTHSFTQTRMCLSECWDKIKEVEKERKKIRAQQRSVFRQNYDEIHSKIEEFNKAYQEGLLPIAEAYKHLDEISHIIKEVELGRDELRALRDELMIARKPLVDKVKQDEQERQNQQQERELQRKNRLQELRDDCEALLRNSEEWDVEKLISERERVLESISQASLSKSEKFEFERLLKPLRDLIAEKKERTLLALSDDDRYQLDQLKDLLKEKKVRRQEIKNQIEQFRKAIGSSGLDFEKAMSFNTQMAEEKERLDKINQGIQEIEQKIASLKTK
jgi:hypothetical protein